MALAVVLKYLKMKKLFLLLFLLPLFANKTIVNEKPKEIQDIDNLMVSLQSKRPIESADALINQFENRRHNLFVAVKYYFDAINGNNASDGLTIFTPKKTIAHLQTLTLAGGDTVCFLRGNNQIYREVFDLQWSGSAGNPIVFTTYGTGASPIISGTDLKPSGWTYYGPNVWKVAATTAPKVAYFNNSRGLQRTSIAAITAPGYWYWVSNVFYCWAPNGSDPSTTYTAPGIEVGVRNRCVNRNSKNYIKFIDIMFQDANDNGGGQGNVRVGTGWVLDHCTSWRGAGSGIEVDAGTGFTITNGTQIIGNGGMGILFGASNTGSIIENSFINDNGWRVDIAASQSSGVQGDLGGVTIYNTEIARNANGTTTKPGQCHGIYFSTATTNVLYVVGCWIHDHAQGAAIKDYCNMVTAGCTLTDNAYEAYEFAGTGSTANRTLFYQNKCSGSGFGFPGFNDIGGGTGNKSATIYNCTFYKMGGTGQQNVFVGKMDTTRIKNTIMVAATGRPNLRVNDTTTTVLQIDYNYYGGNFDNRVGSTDKFSLADWIAGSPCDDNSIAATVDNSMINPPTNMSPGPGSIVIDAGVDVGLSYSGSKPDIGAVETGTIPPKPAIPIIKTTDNRIRYPKLVGTLDGSGSKDDDGTIAAYQWKYISGPYRPAFGDSTAPITSITWPASAGTTIIGTHIFQLKVTDNDNLSDSIQVKFFVAGGTAGGRN